MRFDYGLSAALIGVTIALVQPQVASALSATEVGKIAAGMTVRIESANSRGSGVIIKKSGDTYYVLTSKHVIAKEDKYTIVTPDGDRHSLDYKSVNKLKSGLDLAVLPFNSKKAYPVAKTGNSDTIAAGTIVYVAGFSIPTAAIPNPISRFIDGKITANASKPLYDGYALVYSNNTLPGMSGGPVFNENGEVVGIHGRAETTIDRDSKSIDTGYNLGIPINSYLSVSSSVGANPAITPSPSPAITPSPSPAITPSPPPPLSPSPPLPTTPLKPDDFFLQGGDQSKKGNYQGAITALNQAIQLNPNYADAYNERGFVRSQTGDYKGAITDYDRALFLNTNLAKAYNNRGFARFQLGDYKGAVADYDEAIFINPKDIKALRNRGLAHYRLKNYKKAVVDYNEAISIDPSDAKTYKNRGLALFRQGNYQGAINDYNEAIRIAPNDAETYIVRGINREQLKDYQGAIADYNQFIRLAPKYPDAYILRGNAREQLADYKGAIADYNQAIRINSQLAYAYQYKGNARAKLGDKRGAMADLQRAATLAQKQGKTNLYQLVQNDISKLKL